MYAPRKQHIKNHFHSFNKIGLDGPFLDIYGKNTLKFLNQKLKVTYMLRKTHIVKQFMKILSNTNHVNDYGKS